MEMRMTLVLIAMGMLALTACTGSATERDDRDDVVAKTQTGMPTMATMKDDRSGKLRSITSGWKTDWTRHSIPYDELRWGGPPRDGIPSIDEPHFIPHAQATSRSEEHTSELQSH